MTNPADTASVQKWWDEHPFAFGVSNEKYDQVGTVPLETMDLKYFDEVERRFRKHHRTAAQKDGALILSNLIDYKTLPGKKVLDIATGSGFIAVSLAKAGADVTAIDLTPFAVEHAKKNFALRNLPGTVIQADAQKLPFESQSFDEVIAWGCLMHMPSTEGAIKEIKRVLKPGGQTIAYMYNKSSWPFWFNIVLLRGILMGQFLKYDTYTKLTSRYSDGYSEGGNPLTKFYTPHEVEVMFKDAGFTTVVSKPWVLPHEPESWPLRSFAIFKYLPRSVKTYIARWGYGLIITATS